MTISEMRRYLGIEATPDDKKGEEDLACEIGLMVTEARIVRGMTQEELAERVGTNQSSISRLENGSRLPSLGFLFRVARALDTYLLPPRLGLLRVLNSEEGDK